MPGGTSGARTPDVYLLWAELQLDYDDLGIETILIRGFAPLQDAIDYGRELIPPVRGEVARRDAEIKPANGVAA